MKASLICVGAEAHGDVTRRHMHHADDTWKLPGVFLPVYKGRITVQLRLHTVLIFAKTEVPFMHNSVDTPHSKCLVFLQDTFGPRVISHHHAARHGCGRTGHPIVQTLTPMTFWGYLKEKLFTTKTASIVEVSALLLEICDEITEDRSWQTHCECDPLIINLHESLFEFMDKHVLLYKYYRFYFSLQTSIILCTTLYSD